MNLTVSPWTDEVVKDGLMANTMADIRQQVKFDIFKMYWQYMNAVGADTTSQPVEIIT